MADADRFVQVFHLLGQPESNADPDSGRKCDAHCDSDRYTNWHSHSDSTAIVRTSSDVESDARINLHLFERHLSVERGQCYRLRTRCR